MSLPKHLLNDFYKLFPNNGMMETLPLIKVDLIVKLSFETFGQVWYTDEHGRPWIKEFNGNIWTKEIFMKDNRNIGFSVFVNNQFQEKNKTLTLIKIVNNEIKEQQLFNIDGYKNFDGWFRLG